MTNHPTRPYHQSASQSERERILRNDTFQSRAQAEADEIRGRFSQIEKSNVVGATPTPPYPAGPNWSVDPVPPEPPLGVPIDTHEPVGEFREVEASLGSATSAPSVADLGGATTQASVGQSELVASPADLAGATASASDVDPSLTSDVEAPSPVSSPSGVEPPAIQTPKLRRR